MRLHRAFERRILGRAALAWLGLRVAVFCLGLLMQDILIVLPWLMSVGIVALATAVSVWETARLHETFFLASLGIGLRWVWPVAATAALLPELAIQVAGRL